MIPDRNGVRIMPSIDIAELLAVFLGEIALKIAMNVKMRNDREEFVTCLIAYTYRSKILTKSMFHTRR